MANPSPPVGPALGQQGVNIMEFCKAFNARTESLEKVYQFQLLSLYMQTVHLLSSLNSTSSSIIEKAAGIKSGSGKPNKDKVGKVTLDQVRQIAETKAADMTGATIETKMKSIAGTARSMGLVVEE